MFSLLPHTIFVVQNMSDCSLIFTLEEETGREDREGQRVRGGREGMKIVFVDLGKAKGKGDDE